MLNGLILIKRCLLKNYTKVWWRVSSFIGKEFDSELDSGDSNKYIKTKIKSYGDKVNTIFQGKKVSKENVSYKCLSLIMLDSNIRVNKNYYTQTLLEECKYKIKKNKMENLLNNDLDPSSSDEHESDSDNESDSELDSESDNESGNNESNDGFANESKS